MSPPQLVIFDCDGVLVDSERISHQILQAMLRERGVDLSLEETINKFIGTSTRKTIEILEMLIGRAACADFLDLFADLSRAAFAADLTAVPGVEDVLAWLSVPYCVASNGSREKMAVTLGRTGLLPRFSGRIFSADDVVHPKPAPDLFLHAASSFSALPAQCIVIEDTPTGITAARAAGMTAYGYAAMTPADRLRQAGAHAVFSVMSELPALLNIPDVES